MIAGIAGLGGAGLAGFLFWRHIWFFRNPDRAPPSAEGLVSPADGTVVYVKRVAPGEDVVVIKQGLAATVEDIMREDFEQAKLVIGIFMSPFDVHTTARRSRPQSGSCAAIPRSARTRRAWICAFAHRRELALPGRMMSVS